MKWGAVAAAVALIAGVLWFSPLALKNAAPSFHGAHEVEPVPEVARKELTAKPSGSISICVGLAAVRDGSTTLQTTLDLASRPSGAYQLAVRRQSEDWHLYSAQVQ